VLRPQRKIGSFLKDRNAPLAETKRGTQPALFLDKSIYYWRFLLLSEVCA